MGVVVLLYHYLQKETWHILSPFISTGPGADSAGPDNIKLLNKSVPFLWIIETLFDIWFAQFACLADHH